MEVVVASGQWEQVLVWLRFSAWCLGALVVVGVARLIGERW